MGKQNVQAKEVNCFKVLIQPEIFARFSSAFLARVHHPRERFTQIGLVPIHQRQKSVNFLTSFAGKQTTDQIG